MPKINTINDYMEKSIQRAKRETIRKVLTQHLNTQPEKKHFKRCRVIHDPENERNLLMYKGTALGYLKVVQKYMSLKVQFTPLSHE